MKRRTRRRLLNIVAVTLFAIAVYLNFVRAEDAPPPFVKQDSVVPATSQARPAIENAAEHKVVKN